MNRALIKRGFTLVELILVIGLIAIIGIATVGILHDSHAIWKMTSKRSTLLQDSQAAMEQMLRILRQAKSFDTISASTEEAGSVVFVDVDNITMQFSRDAVDNELDYGEPGDLNALTGAVSSLIFTCYDIDGAALSDPVDVYDIQSVEVNATFTDPDDSSISFTLSGRIFCATDPVAPGPVAHWKLDETSGLTAADSEASYDGTLTQMNGNEWLGGILGGALEFDGSSDYIDTDYTGVAGSNSRTVAFWVKSTSTSDHGIVSWGDNAVSGEKWHIFLNTNGEPGTEGGIRTDVENGYVIGSTNLADDSWHHVASVFKKDGSPDVTDVLHYVDGVLETSSASSSQAVNTSIIGAGAQKVAIARKKNTGFTYFEGFVDDVRIYRMALSSAEVAVLANVLRYREFTEAKTSAETTSLTISTPGGTSEGDLLIAAVATDGDTSSSLAPPGGEGWTEIDINDYSLQVTLGVWWKNADASESSSHQFSWTGSEEAYGWMMRFTGHDSSSPIDDYTSSGDSGSSPTSPSAISTVNYAMILRLGAFDAGNITEDSPGLSGHTAITMDRAIGQVVYEEFTEAKAASDTTSLTISTPSGTSEGDLLIAVVSTDGNTELSLAPPGGQGWTEIDIEDGANQVTLGVWWKSADASEPGSHQFTWSGSQEAYGWMMRFTGHDAATPIHQSAAISGMSSSPSSPAVTTTIASCLILRIGAFEDGDVTVDSPGLSGHTAITMDESSSGSGACSGGAGYKQQVSTGSSGTSTFSLTGTNKYRTLTIAIAPAGAVSGGAGWLSQSSSGSSGTSTFELTASQEAQLLTIAITPDPDGGSQ